MKQKKKTIFLSLGVIIAAVTVFAAYNITRQQMTIAAIDTFDECVAAGYPVQETFPERCAVPGGKSFTREIIGGQNITAEGKIVCLPPKNPGGPHTLECAIGLVTDNGTYYGLHTPQSDSPVAEATGSDRRIRIEGTLKSDTTNKYQSNGTIEVTAANFIQ